MSGAVLSLLQMFGFGLLLVGILLILVCVFVLFCPALYRLEGEWQEEKWIRFQLHWLLHLVRLKISYGDNLIYGELHFFWKKKTFSQDFTSEEIEEDVEETEEDIMDKIKDVADDVADIGKEETQTNSTEKSFWQTTSEKESFSKKKNKPKKKSIVSKIKDMLNGIKEIYKRVKKIWTDKQHKEAFRHLKKEFFYLVKILLPKKSNGNAVFSTGSPDTTGQLFGILSSVFIVYQNGWNITPDFQEEKPYFKGSFWAKGKIALYSLVGIVIRVILDKNCRRLYHHIRKFINWIKKKSWEGK